MERFIGTDTANVELFFNVLTSQWISLQDKIQADHVGMENDVHGVLGQTGSNPRRQTSMTQGQKSWSHDMINVSISEVNMLKNSSTLAVSVPINIPKKLVFVSVNKPRETYFVDALCRTLRPPGT